MFSRIAALGAGLCLGLAATAPAPAQQAIGLGQTVTGSLDPGDRRLRSGEYYEVYEFWGVAGQRVCLRMDSNQIDTYLIVESPCGYNWENDDLNGLNAGMDITLLQTGRHRIFATSFAARECGPFALSLTPHPNAGYSQPGSQILSGTLDTSDRRRLDRYYDDYDLDLVAGEWVSLRLNSNAFDTVLEVRSPCRRDFENDDFSGTLNSGLDFRAPSTGTYRVRVTSYERRACGPYELQFH